MFEDLSRPFRTRLFKNKKGAEATDSAAIEHFSHSGTCDICMERRRASGGQIEPLQSNLFR